jgi:ABC-type Fe3+-hydroxamate transport system substrate-binding protein
MKKAQANAKGASKNKASLRDAERETHKMRKELLEAREINKQLQQRVQELREQVQRASNRPAVSHQLKENSQSSHPNTNNPQQTQEISRLQVRLEDT